MKRILVNRLNKDYINELPVINFNGDVIVVETPEHEEDVVRELEEERFIGFDTESRPSFKKGEIYPVSLVQLATHKRAYLFQLQKTGFTDALANLLADETVKKIGVDVKHDIQKLQELKPFKAEGFIDMAKVAKEKGIIQNGLRNLAARYTGHRLIKSAQKTNWARSRLTHKQQTYAALDAWICLKIYPELLADNTDYKKILEKELEQEGGKKGKKKTDKKASQRTGRKTGKKVDKKSDNKSDESPDQQPAPQES